MLDRAVFVRPIAHRGLHGGSIIENTAAAFEAALVQGYGVECDLQPSADGTPMVFHDERLDRLIDGSGRVDALTPAALAALRYKATADRILSFDAFLDLCAGRGPLLVEIKSEWGPARTTFLQSIARAASAYRGPLALMSFDPAVVVAMADLAPTIPRGIVAGRYAGAGWWMDKLGALRAAGLADLLESGPARPSFFAYDVKALPTSVTSYVRAVHGLPLFAWTVRTDADRAAAALHADAPIFEGYTP